MPIQLVWENDQKTILRQVLIGRWTLDEYMINFEDMRALYRSVSHDIDLIIDLRASETNPLSMISSLSRSESMVEPNHRSVTVVGINPVIRVLGSVTTRIAPRLSRNLYFADTLEEAHTHILKARAKRAAHEASRRDR